jgi:hypothetical protein
VFVGNIAVKPLTTPILRRFGFRTVLLVNGAATTALFLLCGLLGPGTPLVAMVTVLFVSGVCRSVSLTAYSTIGFADITADRTSTTNALSNTVQPLATGVGVAFARWRCAPRPRSPRSSVCGGRRRRTSSLSYSWHCSHWPPWPRPYG